MCRELVKALNPRLSIGEELWSAAAERVAEALRGVSGNTAAELEKRGFAREYRELSFPGVLVWGRVEPAEKKVFVDREALKLLGERLAASGRNASSAQLEALVLAHELFHIIDSRCPSEYCEPAAIIFSLRLTGLLQPDRARPLRACKICLPASSLAAGSGEGAYMCQAPAPGGRYSPADK